MAISYSKPVGVTSPDGEQVANLENGRGFVIRQNGQDVLVLGYQQQQNLALVLNDGTTNRLMLGVFPDGTIGMIITKAGYDVYDALA
jgi:hypothetical protein